jgi:allantoin racemase
MRILVVNPNTTATMTETIGAAARRAASPGVEVEALNPAMGPASIEGYYDEAFCVPGLIGSLRERAGHDAYVVACFDDTGLDAARTVVRAPVVGLCEASLHVASMLGARCAVVTTLARSVPALERLVAHYGMGGRCGVHASDIPVLGLESGDAEARLTEAVERAIAAERAECVVLGCAGMTDLAARMGERFGLPVLDPIACAVRIAEALAGLGVETSKVGGYADPLAKPYTGAMAPFAPR